MSTSSSKSDKKSIEKIKENELNKLYWFRVILAGISGVISALLYVHAMGYLTLVSPIIFYLASLTVYKFKRSIELIGKRKAGYHGLGSYIITWLVIYMLTLTLILA